MGKGQVVLYVGRPHYVDKRVVVIKKVFSYNWQRKKSTSTNRWAAVITYPSTISSSSSSSSSLHFSLTILSFFFCIFFCLVDQIILSFSAVGYTISSSSLLAFQCHNLKSGWNWAFGCLWEIFFDDQFQQSLLSVFPFLFFFLLSLLLFFLHFFPWLPSTENHQLQQQQQQPPPVFE